MIKLKSVKKPEKGRIDFLINIAYALYNGVLGVVGHSWWMITLCAYYALLSVMRYAVISVAKKKSEKSASDVFVMRFTGAMLVALSVVLAGMTYLSYLEDHGTKYHEIVMITIALYSFTKITTAIVRLVKSRKGTTAVKHTLLYISFADALVSIYSLQRSMLVSFEGMTDSEIVLMNSLTGSGAYILIFVLGVNLIGGKRVKMAKSKLVQANQKIAEAVTGGYKKIEKGVVTGYKKVEQGVVKGYEKIEDKFVDRYLTKNGESVEEAKKRLRKEQDNK